MLLLLLINGLVDSEIFKNFALNINKPNKVIVAISDILKNLYFGNFRMIIINIYYLLRIKKIYKIYNSPDYFP